jgi:CRP-like cAMP-binding protein
MFSDLDPSILGACVLAFGESKFWVDSEVCRQGEEIEYFYIVKSGKLLQTKRQNHWGSPDAVGGFGRGDFWGELSLLHSAKSGFSVKGETDGAVWVLGRGDFDGIRRKAAKKRRAWYYEF